jgi:hypothetical protein
VGKYDGARGVAGKSTSIIQRMRISCWVVKATDTYTEYVILTAFPRENASANETQCYVYSHISSLVKTV